MKTILCVLSLMPVLAFAGVSTGPAGAGSGGSATNVTLRAGNNITIVTNSSSDWTITPTGDVTQAALAAGTIPVGGFLTTNSQYTINSTLKLRADGTLIPRVIWVTDWSSDFGENHGGKHRMASMDRGEIEIIAVICSLTNEYCGANMSLWLSSYGHPEIPVAVSRTNFYAPVVNVTNSVFRSFLPLALYNSNYPSDVDLIRHVLSHQMDNSVIFDWEGEMTPLYNLKNTTADQFSSLDGLGLLGRKTLYHFINAGDTNAYDFTATVTGANAGDVLTHATLPNSLTGQSVAIISDGGTVPGGITASTPYYLIKLTATTSQLATTYSNAVNGVAIVFNSDSVGALRIDDRLRDGINGDFNLHQAASYGPPIINDLTNKIVWLWAREPFFYPSLTDDVNQGLWVGQNVTNTQIHPVHMPMYQDATNYTFIQGVSPFKSMWDGFANLFIAFGTNHSDGTQMFKLSGPGKCTVSAVFEGHVDWTNNVSGVGVGNSNHYYLTLKDGFRNSTTNYINKYIDAAPTFGGLGGPSLTNFALLTGAEFTGTVTGKLGTVSSVTFGTAGGGNNGINMPATSYLEIVANGVIATRAFGNDLYQSSGGMIIWASGTIESGASADTGIGRNAAGVVEINSGVQGTLRDLRLRAILGVTDASSVSAGGVGETITSAVASGSAVSLTTATTANITSISLTAGDWDVSGNVNFAETATTITGGPSAGITTTSVTVPSDGTEVYSSGGVGVVAFSATDGVTLPRKRINVSSTTTVYLVGRLTFSAGTAAGFGSITARRLR